MRLEVGARVRLTLTDGTTLEGRVNRRPSLLSQSWHLGRVSAVTQHGASEAVGRFIVPNRSVLLVQVLPDPERED